MALSSEVNKNGSEPKCCVVFGGMNSQNVIHEAARIIRFAHFVHAIVINKGEVGGDKYLVRFEDETDQKLLDYDMLIGGLNVRVG